jgi:hypothetical protein
MMATGYQPMRWPLTLCILLGGMSVFVCLMLGIVR